MTSKIRPALGFAGALQSQLHGTSARNPFTLMAVTRLLVGVGYLACLLPAFRAMRIDLIRVLQSEQGEYPNIFGSADFA